VDIKLKHRLVGACVILALAVFFLPLILDSEKYRSEIETQIPENSTLQSDEKAEPESSNQGALTINLDEDEPEKAIIEDIKSDKKPVKSIGKEGSVNKTPANTLESDEENTESELQTEEGEDKAEVKDSNVDVSSKQTAQQTKESNEVAEDSGRTADNTKQKADAESVPETKNEPVVQKEPAAKKDTASNKNTVSKKNTPKFEEQAWVIQIGSFSNKDNAAKLVSDLRTQGYRAYERVSGEYSRVYVGPYPDKKAADSRQQGLEDIIGTPVKIIEFDAQAH